MSEYATAQAGRDVHPESMPEARRELTMIRGSFHALDNSVTELLDRLKDFLRDVEPSPEKESLGPPPSLVVNSPYGRDLRGISDEMSQLEYRVRVILNRLEL